MKPMTANQIPINYTFTLDTVNVIIGALAKLPFEQVEPVITNIRSVAIQALRDAEAQVGLTKEVEE